MVGPGETHLDIAQRHPVPTGHLVPIEEPWSVVIDMPPQAAGRIHSQRGAPVETHSGHRQGFQVAPVIRVLVAEHHRIQGTQIVMELEVGEGAVAQVDEDRESPSLNQVSTGCPTRARIPPVAAQDGEGQSHEATSTWASSGPSNRDPSSTKTAGSPDE